jgi:hypothetical protein
MRVFLYNNPQTPEMWDQWEWHHRLSHDAIRRAILQQKTITLTDYDIQPIAPQDMLGFLQRNSQLHIEMNGVLNAPAQDLEDVDFQVENQRVNWLWIHAKEHETAENLLGISS